MEVIGQFVKDDEVPRDVLAGIVKKSCASFRHEEVTPLVKIDGHYVLVSFVNWCMHSRSRKCQIIEV